MVELDGKTYKVYSWEDWSHWLMTKNQLSEAGYQTGKNIPPIRGLLRRAKSPDGYVRLYDPAEAVPKRKLTEAQQKALAKAKIVRDDIKWLQEAIWLDCPRCGEWYDDETSRLSYLLDMPHYDNAICDDCSRRDEIKAKTQKLMESLVDAPTWADVYEQVAEIIKDKRLVIYNSDFDMMILQAMCKAYSLPDVQPKKVICAMNTYASWVGEWSNYFGSYKWQPLYGGDHTALGDCQATLTVMKEMAGIRGEEMHFDDLPTDSLNKYEWSAEVPIFMSAGTAFDLISQGIQRNEYYLPMWMDGMIGGYDAFIFDSDKNRVGMSELHILRMNRYDTDFDVPAIISANEAIYAPNLDVPEAYREQVYYP